jgi:hypothetical protein
MSTRALRLLSAGLVLALGASALGKAMASLPT